MYPGGREQGLPPYNLPPQQGQGGQGGPSPQQQEAFWQEQAQQQRAQILQQQQRQQSIQASMPQLSPPPQSQGGGGSYGGGAWTSAGGGPHLTSPQSSQLSPEDYMAMYRSQLQQQQQQQQGGGGRQQIDPSMSAAPRLSPYGSSHQSSPTFQTQQQQQQQQQPPPPSVLRSAINAPNFVPKSGLTPPFTSQTNPPPPAGGPGYLKSSAVPFEPGANLNSNPNKGGLAVQAAPFIPGGASKAKAGTGGPSFSKSSSSKAQLTGAGEGLNTQAVPFEPGGGRGRGGEAGTGGGGQAGGDYYLADEGYEDEDEDGEGGPTFYGDEIFDWSMGASSLPAPSGRTLQRAGIPEQLRQFFLLKDLDRLRSLPPDDERYKEIPPRYHLAYPLDDANKPRGTTGAFGYPSVVYKVASHDDGNIYALRRYDSIRTTPKIVGSAVENWRRIQHPTVLKLQKAFIQHGALFFVHEYGPASQSLMQRYITGRGSQKLPEKLLWSFIVQLVAAIRTVHAAQSACRMIHPNYILVTHSMRLRLGCAGVAGVLESGARVADVLESETRKSLAELQKEDLFLLGRLMVMLSTRSLVTPQTFSASLNMISQYYSPELHSLIVQLCTKPLTVFDLAGALSRHIMDELDRQYVAVDDLEGHLSKEYESSRLFRLSLKLAQLSERPEDQAEQAWEAGHRYIVKLFRDYVYHQVDEEGNPVLDLGHIVHSLNRLDIGDPEKIVLMSRDQQSMIIVSFDDVKRCLETAWMELCGTANTNPVMQEIAQQDHHQQQLQGQQQLQQMQIQMQHHAGAGGRTRRYMHHA